MSVKLQEETIGQVDNITISPQPIEIHMPHLFRVIIHQPDGGSAPLDGGFAPVFVSDCECTLPSQPPLVRRKKLEVALNIVKDGVLGVFQSSLQVVHVPL